MKLMAALITFLIISGVSYSQQNKVEINTGQKIVEVNTMDRKISEPVNNICPIEGKEINKELSQLIYNNKIIGFCCPGCDEVFLKNPKLYESKLNRKNE